MNDVFWANVKHDALCPLCSQNANECCCKNTSNKVYFKDKTAFSVWQCALEIEYMLKYCNERKTFI